MAKTPTPITLIPQPQEDNLPTIPLPEDHASQVPHHVPYHDAATSIPVPTQQPIPPLKLRRLLDNTWVKADDPTPTTSDHPNVDYLATSNATNSYPTPTHQSHSTVNPNFPIDSVTAGSYSCVPPHMGLP